VYGSGVKTLTSGNLLTSVLYLNIKKSFINEGHYKVPPLFL